MSSEEPASLNKTGQSLLSSGLVAALTDYVIDPTNYENLTNELEKIDWNWPTNDPGDLLVQLSKAETLSWKIKSDSGDMAGEGFAFALLDDRDQIVAHSDNLLQLGEYLTISKKQKLNFTHNNSRISFEDGKARLRTAPRGHILVEITHPHKAQRRYGYLVAEHEFP